jgi:hypothetical protein
MDDRQPDDAGPEPDDHGNLVLVPLIRLDGRDLETRRTLWFWATERNQKAIQALRDRSESDG